MWKIPQTPRTQVTLVMDAISSLCKTIESVVRLVSTDNTDNPVQLNARQCELLAKKASGTLNVLQEFRNLLHHQEGPKVVTHDWLQVVLELRRVLKDAEILIRDCCCGGQWWKVAINRGNLKETFGKLLYDIDWHTSVLCSPMVRSKSDESVDVFEKSACDGKLAIAEHFILVSAAKQDRDSLRELLKSFSHVCDGETCPSRGDNSQSCLAVQFLLKLDAEEEELADRSADLLWVRSEELEKGRKLQGSNFTKVKETTWLGQKYAIKIFKGSNVDNYFFKQEVAVMAGLDHPHVVRVVCCSKHNHSFCIVMELMYKSLFDLIQDYHKGTHAAGATTPFPIIQSVGLMLQIAEGVKYLHSKSLVHRDLKSLNILVQFADPQTTPTDSLNTVLFTDRRNSFVAKIADFGLTKMKHESTRRTHQTSDVGTTAWMAPEVFKYVDDDEFPEPSPRFHPMKTDVYSFGMVCYEIVSGKTPFADVNKQSVLRKQVKSGIRPPLPEEKIPARLAVLIKRCWDGNPRLRPDFAAICTELRYITGLLLQGKDLALKQTAIAIGPVFDLNPEIKVQGPWGGNNGGPFSDGVGTSIKQMKLKYDDGRSPCIYHIEMEYDVNGTSFVTAHGDSRYGSKTVQIKIDEPTEYITQIEGWVGIYSFRAETQIISGLTIHTNEKTYGPFGGEGERKFTSDTGRILGFYGRCARALDQIGCFTAPT